MVILLKREDVHDSAWPCIDPSLDWRPMDAFFLFFFPSFFLSFLLSYSRLFICLFLFAFSLALCAAKVCSNSVDGSLNTTRLQLPGSDK